MENNEAHEALIHVSKTEWVVINGNTIKTKDSFYSYKDYLKSGGLKKNAKKRQQQVFFDYMGFSTRRLLEQICFEHNYFVNRNDKDALAQMLEREVKRATVRVRFFAE